MTHSNPTPPKDDRRKTVHKNNHFRLKPLFLFLAFISFIICKGSESSDSDLIEMFLQSRGTRSIIFNASNIKQFWIASSVISSDNLINIYMNKDKTTYSSVPLNIQLKNVSYKEDCVIEVLTQNSDASFSILNSNSEVLSTSTVEDSFINYNVLSSTIHLFETDNLSFSFKFSSKKSDLLSIKAIALTFKPNRLFDNPKHIINASNASANYAITTNDDNTFSITGKRSSIFAKEKIPLTDKELFSFARIKNIGDKPATIYFGYQLFTKDNYQLKLKNYPFKGENSILKVLSSVGNKIVVDQYGEYDKLSVLALNAKEDMSDIPNLSLVNGKILDINKIENGNAEIVMDHSLESPLKEGTKVRIHVDRGGYFYTHIKRINPGEEIMILSQRKKDDSLYEYSSIAFPHGVSYVLPLILSYSVDSNEDNTILVSDFFTTY